MRGVIAALVALLCLASPTLAQEKGAFRPTKTVTIIVPYSPGGGTDVVGRLMAQALEPMWGQTRSRHWCSPGPTR